MPGQWEFQIGFRGIEGEAADALTMADHAWLARFMLRREAERVPYRPLRQRALRAPDRAA